MANAFPVPLLPPVIIQCLGLVYYGVTLFVNVTDGAKSGGIDEIKDKTRRVRMLATVIETIGWKVPTYSVKPTNSRM
jgi:hypothetical protein